MEVFQWIPPVKILSYNDEKNKNWPIFAYSHKWEIEDIGKCCYSFFHNIERQFVNLLAFLGKELLKLFPKNKWKSFNEFFLSEYCPPALKNSRIAQVLLIPTSGKLRILANAVTIFSTIKKDNLWICWLFWRKTWSNWFTENMLLIQCSEQQTQNFVKSWNV